MKDKSLYKEIHENGETTYLFFCQGCGFGHVYDKRWKFNGNMEKPTFTPSYLQHENKSANHPRCLLYVTDGKIKYLNDSTHHLAGKTVPMKKN